MSSSVLTPKKEYGQNFLTDSKVAKILVDSANITKEDTVIEIGPGKGTVTELLLERAQKVIAVEIDVEFIEPLHKMFEEAQNLDIINKDALWFLKEVPLNQPKANKIVTSLPYQITSPFLHTLVNLRHNIKTSSVLIQKEVAKRVTQVPPDANYMSIFLGTFLDIQLIQIVPKEKFFPIPQVDGAIITVTPKKDSDILIEQHEITKYSKFLHHGFLQKRKMLNKRFDKELLEAVQIDGSRRAETLSIEEWIKLFRKFSK